MSNQTASSLIFVRTFPVTRDTRRKFKGHHKSRDNCHRLSWFCLENWYISITSECHRRSNLTSRYDADKRSTLRDKNCRSAQNSTKFLCIELIDNFVSSKCWFYASFFIVILGNDNWSSHSKHHVTPLELWNDAQNMVYTYVPHIMSTPCVIRE